MSDDINYKVYMGRGSDGEVRRLKVSSADKNSLAFLKEEIVESFPDLKSSKFAISWTDSDGDNVKIGSNNELAIALEEMAGKMMKINITVDEEKAAAKPAPAPEPAPAPKKVEETYKGPVHTGVSCDGCGQNPIRGVRMKCQVCPNIDLCESCFQQCKHPGHTMWKLANPGDVNNIRNSGGGGGGRIVRRGG